MNRISFHFNCEISSFAIFNEIQNMFLYTRQRLKKIVINPDIRLGEYNIRKVKEAKTFDVIIDDQL